jgi:protoheme IX farnesyltransferase
MEAVKHKSRIHIPSYLQLIKFRLTSTVAATSVFGYLIGCKVNAISGEISERFDWIELLAVLIGGMFVVFASNGMNQIIEKSNDGKMNRTAARPIVEDRIPYRDAVIFCWITGILGMIILSLKAPFISVFIAGLSLVLYVFVYTPMKQVSPLAVLVGAFPGAFPPLIGYTAITGRLDEVGVLLFLVQFFWQFPHFWAIAWLLHDDYLKAGYWLLPSKGGRDKKSAYNILIYTVLLFLVSIMPIYYQVAEPKAGMIVLPVGLIFIYFAYRLFKSLEIVDARKLLFASFLYTPLVFLAYIIF